MKERRGSVFFRVEVHEKRDTWFFKILWGYYFSNLELQYSLLVLLVGKMLSHIFVNVKKTFWATSATERDVSVLSGFATFDRLTFRARPGICGVAVAEWCAWNCDRLGRVGRKLTAAELRVCGHHPLFFGGGVCG